MKKLKWQEREDGVFYCEPNGLIESYFIYLPNYDDDGKTAYILSIIDNNGKVISEYATLNLDEAKSKALEKFELTLNLLQSCFE